MISDKEALRAFVEPAIYPFILEVYKDKGKGEDILKEDLRKAREVYKKIVGEEKKPKNKNTKSSIKPK